MSSFTDQLQVTPFDDNMTRWLLLKEFEYVIGDLKTGTEKVVVPKGFITDFATTKFMGWLLPSTGKYGKASVVHDYLCDEKIIRDRAGNPVRKASRKEADKIFLEAMKESDVNWIIRHIMYLGVRTYAILSKKK